MTREVKNGKVAFKGGQCVRMDHHVWQVVPGTNNTVRENNCFLSYRINIYRITLMSVVISVRPVSPGSPYTPGGPSRPVDPGGPL